MPKKRVSEHFWTVNMLKGSKDCLNQHGTIFLIFFLTLWNKISSKNSVLVVSEILRLIVNNLTPNEMYCLSVKTSV